MDAKPLPEFARLAIAHHSYEAALGALRIKDCAGEVAPDPQEMLNEYLELQGRVDALGAFIHG